jgi:hypothetical protein
MAINLKAHLRNSNFSLHARDVDHGRFLGCLNRRSGGRKLPK